MMKSPRKYYNNCNHLATHCQLQTEGAAYRRAESGIRREVKPSPYIIMRGGNARGLVSWRSQDEFSNHFYWNSSAAGSSLKAAEYVDLKKMQPYSLTVSLDSLAEILETVSAISCSAHFLAFHIFPPLLPSITRSWEGKLLPLTFFLYYASTFHTKFCNYTK